MSKLQSPPWDPMESPRSAPAASALSASALSASALSASASPATPTPRFTPATWIVLVSADRAYYDRMRAAHIQASTDVAFPAHAVERRVLLTGHQLRIGRRSAVRELEPEIDLAEPPVDPGISRLHATLIAAPDGTWSVLDAGSANGTLLNGREITVGDLNPLRAGDRINLGAWTVISVHRG